MKKIFVANWKSNKTREETFAWVKETREGLEKSDAEIIICPSFAVIDALVGKLGESRVKVGAQNVSQYPSGAYTGEVSAEILKAASVSHCIVGHSERKKYFGETPEQVTEKIKQLLAFFITPILCVADVRELDVYLENYQDIASQAQKIVFVYEPPLAISGGGDYHPESSDEAAREIAQFKNRIGAGNRVLYGGSVNPEVIGDFLEQEQIDGFLVGKASLNPGDFLALLPKAR